MGTGGSGTPAAWFGPKVAAGTPAKYPAPAAANGPVATTATLPAPDPSLPGQVLTLPAHDIPLPGKAARTPTQDSALSNQASSTPPADQICTLEISFSSRLIKIMIQIFFFFFLPSNFVIKLSPLGRYKSRQGNIGGLLCLT